MSATAMILDEPGTCPDDAEFVHDNYYGCVPQDFQPCPGTSRTHKQTAIDGRFRWDGGCGWYSSHFVNIGGEA